MMGHASANVSSDTNRVSPAPRQGEGERDVDRVSHAIDSDACQQPGHERGHRCEALRVVIAAEDRHEGLWEEQVNRRDRAHVSEDPLQPRVRRSLGEIGPVGPSRWPTRIDTA